MIRKVIFLLVFIVSFSFSNENVVKTSELELFLFKVGFESLLKDVELTKDKSILNESEIKKINDKVDLILDELYKNKRVLKTDNQTITLKDESYKEEIRVLKEEINFLKSQIKNLILSKDIKKLDTKRDTFSAKVISKEVNIRQNPNNSSSILDKLRRDEIIDLEYCNNYGWCKLKNKDGFIAKFLIDLNY